MTVFRSRGNALKSCGSRSNHQAGVGARQRRFSFARLTVHLLLQRQREVAEAQTKLLHRNCGTSVAQTRRQGLHLAQQRIVAFAKLRST